IRHPHRQPNPKNHHNRTITQKQQPQSPKNRPHHHPSIPRIRPRHHTPTQHHTPRHPTRRPMPQLQTTQNETPTPKMALHQLPTHKQTRPPPSTQRLPTTHQTIHHKPQHPQLPKNPIQIPSKKTTTIRKPNLQPKAKSMAKKQLICSTSDDGEGE